MVLFKLFDSLDVRLIAFLLYEDLCSIILLLVVVVSFREFSTVSYFLMEVSSTPSMLLSTDMSPFLPSVLCDLTIELHDLFLNG